MSWSDVYEFLRSFWVVWLMVLFVAIVFWAYRPKRKSTMEEHGRIPLDDDNEET